MKTDCNDLIKLKVQEDFWHYDLLHVPTFAAAETKRWGQERHKLLMVTSAPWLCLYSPNALRSVDEPTMTVTKTSCRCRKMSIVMVKRTSCLFTYCYKFLLTTFFSPLDVFCHFGKKGGYWSLLSWILFSNSWKTPSRTFQGRRQCCVAMTRQVLQIVP